MAEDQNVTLSETTGDTAPPTGANKKDSNDVEWAPGVLCAIEAPPDKILTVDALEEAALKTLNGKIAMYDMPSRREQLVKVWEARLFDRGYQHLLPRQNGGWELPAIGSGYGPGEEEDRSQWEIDIYSSYRKIICAALTRAVPNVDFQPSDQDDDRDITAASSANKLTAKIHRDNKMKELQGEAARFLWTDGLSVHFTRYVLDAQGYGYEPEPKGDVPEDEETGRAATELDNHGEADAGDVETGDAGHEDAGDEVRGLPEEKSGENESDTGDEEGNVTTGQAEGGTPRGHELITVAGALNWKLPIKANCLAECGYARLSYEQSVSLTKAQYPDKADLIKPSRSGSEDQGGDDLERLARINVMLGVEDNFITEDSAVYDVTIQKFFYRPSELFNIPDKGIRNDLLKRFPRGIYATWAGDILLETRNASMDDHITLTFADAGDGVHRQGLGSPLIAPQKILNTCAELAYEYFVHGVPQTYMDDEMFDVDAINAQENTVGGVLPFESDGQAVEGVKWFRESNLPFPDKLFEFVNWLMEDVAQLMSGAYPALFGGDTGDNDTAAGQVIARDQALGRLGLPWRNIKECTASVTRQSVQCLAHNMEGVIKLGGNEKGIVDVADLKGNILCYPDTDENFPETWTQRSNRFAQIITDAATNPFFQKMLDSPGNLKLCQTMSGFKELVLPQLVSWEQQMGEIAILLDGKPVPNPDIVDIDNQIAKLQAGMAQLNEVAAPALPMIGSALPAPAPPPPELAAAEQEIAQLTQAKAALPPMVSSYPIDDTDDHDVHSATCLDALRAPKGRALKNGTTKDQLAFENLKLHMQEHDKVIAQKAKEAAAAAASAAVAPPKPPSFSFSANAKDLPPAEAAQVLAKGGIQSNAADFEKQDQDEAIAKHPVTLGGAAPPK